MTVVIRLFCLRYIFAAGTFDVQIIVKSYGHKGAHEINNRGGGGGKVKH